MLLNTYCSAFIISWWERVLLSVVRPGTNSPQQLDLKSVAHEATARHTALSSEASQGLVLLKDWGFEWGMKWGLTSTCHRELLAVMIRVSLSPETNLLWCKWGVIIPLKLGRCDWSNYIFSLSMWTMNCMIPNLSSHNTSAVVELKIMIYHHVFYYSLFSDDLQRPLV